VAPVEEDGGIAGRHLIGKVNRAAIRELQGQRREPVTLRMTNARAMLPPLQRAKLVQEHLSLSCKRRYQRHPSPGTEERRPMAI
jgi:hypothetical protein